MTSNRSNLMKIIIKPKCGISVELLPTRFFVGATLFLVTFTSYNLRCNLSVIIKGMVELKTDDNSTIVPDVFRFIFY